MSVERDGWDARRKSSPSTRKKNARSFDAVDVGSFEGVAVRGVDLVEDKGDDEGESERGPEATSKAAIRAVWRPSRVIALIFVVGNLEASAGPENGVP